MITTYYKLEILGEDPATYYITISRHAVHEAAHNLSSTDILDKAVELLKVGNQEPPCLVVSSAIKEAVIPGKVWMVGKVENGVLHMDISVNLRIHRAMVERAGIDDAAVDLAYADRTYGRNKWVIKDVTNSHRLVITEHKDIALWKFGLYAEDCGPLRDGFSSASIPIAASNNLDTLIDLDYKHVPELFMGTVRYDHSVELDHEHEHQSVMEANPLGGYVRYEDFVRVVKALERKANDAVTTPQV